MQNLRKFDKPPMEQQKICFFISTSTAQIQGLNYWLATLRKQKVCKKPEIKASTSYKKNLIWLHREIMSLKSLDYNVQMFTLYQNKKIF